MAKRKQTRDDVVELVRRLIPEERAFADDLQAQIGRRRLVGQLAHLRNEKRVTQEDVAKQLQCTQSRVSKIENGYDEDLTIKVLAAYARLFDSDLTILFSAKEDSLVSQIKFHAMCIKTCFEQLNELVQEDDRISKGVADFHLEALFNLIKIVGDAHHSLRATISPSVEPQIRLQVQEATKSAARPLASATNPLEDCGAS